MNNYEILETLNGHVYGHIKAKKILINMINRSQLRWSQKYILGYPEEALLKTTNALIMGPSGTGKTYLVENVSRIMGIPFFKLDATQLTHTSAVGLSPEKVYAKIHKEAKRIYTETQTSYTGPDEILDQMIIFVDEIDKLANTSGDGWQQQTQANFLSLFENKAEFKGLSFVFAGAFSGLELFENNTAKSRGIGFADTNKQEVAGYDELSDQIIKYGLIPELVGRLGTIAVLDKLEESDYNSILYKVILPSRAAELEQLGVDINRLRLDVDVVKKAFNSGQGVRYLHKAVEESSIDLEFEASSPRGVELLDKVLSK